MRITILIYIFLTISVLIYCSTSTNEEVFECNSENNSINVIFKYGFGARNILNTFDCTFQKGVYLEPPATTHLTLTLNELDSIYALMQSVNFFNYPDTFFVVGDWYNPYSTYVFYVEVETLQKNLFWEDRVWNNSPPKADSLRVLINFIINIIESKEEYKSLPEPG